MSNSLFEFHLKFRSNYYNVNIIIELHFEKNKNKIKQKQTNKQTNISVHLLHGYLCECIYQVFVHIYQTYVNSQSRRCMKLSFNQ